VRPLFTRAEARAVDAHAITVLGVPGLVLMENAGAGATRVLCRRFPERLGRVLCVGGLGQNGGDAWVVARHLLTRGITPVCAIVGEASRVRGDAAVNLAALHRLGVAVPEIADAAALAQLAQGATLIVDGLFGTGLDRALAGLHAEAVAVLDAAGAPIVALDLPSGIDADTGAVLGAALHAALTLTFAAEKRGLSQYPGRAHAGEVHVVPLGVPLADAAGSAALIDGRDLIRWLPVRAAAGHQGSHGHVALFAGSPGKTGAAMLAALGAHRMGAGLVTLASDPDTQRALDAKALETMTHALRPEHALEDALALAAGKAACLVGPGFGLSTARRNLAQALGLGLAVPTVLDADALQALADGPSALRNAAGPRVLTPHPGEAARLLGTGTEAIARDRFAAARALASLTGHVVVLKGAGTLVAGPDGRLLVCARGTPAMGTGGTGDVLAGAVTALLGVLPAFEAAAAAVELHARAGELCCATDRGLLASELAAALPAALAGVRAQA